MSKIAIITLFGDHNFGNKLQNYATQIYFEKLGHSVCTITYHEYNATHSAIASFVHTIMKYWGRFFKAKSIKRTAMMSKRCDYLGTFNEYIKMGPKIDYHKIPDSLNEQYDYFITGSDQVWRCWYGDSAELEFFLLTWVDRKKRLTMSPCFGLDKIPDEYKAIYKHGLEGFNYLSCREENGSRMIRELTGKECLTTLDPTMLIDEKEWIKILRRPKRFIQNKYIFVYAIGGLKGRLKELTNELAIKKSFDVIDIQDIDSYYFTHTRPDEFLYWIKNSELVITDSFHASVFSILFEKQFIVYERLDLKGMLDRIYTVLDIFGLSERKFNIERQWNDLSLFEAYCFDKIDYSQTHSVLKQEREKAAEFYRKCFEEDGL